MWAPKKGGEAWSRGSDHRVQMQLRSSLRSLKEPRETCISKVSRALGRGGADHRKLWSSRKEGHWKQRGNRPWRRTEGLPQGPGEGKGQATRQARAGSLRETPVFVCSLGVYHSFLSLTQTTWPYLKHHQKQWEGQLQSILQQTIPLCL